MNKMNDRKHPIEILISQGEHQLLDFKFEVNDSKKIARTLSAFANTDGGRLLIGVKDNGSISGIRSEEELYMIEAASTMYTRPEVPFRASLWNIRGKNVLEVYVAPSSDKPHAAPDKDDKYQAYIRVKDENLPANEILTLAWRKMLKREGTLLKISRPVEKLLDYLERNAWISIGQFCRIAHINYHVAKSIVSDLMAIDALRYVVVDKRIVYELGGMGDSRVL